MPADDKAPRTLWLLSDGLPGHVNQARGMARLLARGRELTVIEVPVRLRLKWLRPLLALWLNLGLGLPPALIRAVYDGDWPRQAPDLVLSAGGNTSFMNALLGRHFGCANLFIGSLRRLRAECFTIVFTLEPVGSERNIVMATPPSLVNADELDEMARGMAAGRSDQAPLYALLIGGDGAGFRYGPEDWRDLAEGMAALSASSGCRWLLSTSRRTGAEAERCLRGLVATTIVEDAVWFGEAPRPVVREFLAGASCVFVSADSMSMLADAMASGRQTVAFLPRQAAPDLRYRDAIRRFDAQGYLTLLPVGELAGFRAEAALVGRVAAAQDDMLRDIEARLYGGAADRAG